MTVEVKVPRLAESISEAVLAQWLKQDGERVRTDEPIATLETDKAAVELPADVGGVLHHARKVGETVVVGDVIARIDEAAGVAEPKEDGPKRAPKPLPVPVMKAAPPAVAKPAPASPPAAPKPAPAPTRAEPASPPPAAPRPPAPPAPSPAAPTLGPAVRRLVEELGLDPSSIPASGPGGRLLKEDVQRFVQAQVRAPEARSAPPASATPAATPSGAIAWNEGEEERPVPMSRIRRRIAERLVEAQQTAAILTTFNEVDMTAVMDLRARFKESFEARHGVRLSFMSFFGRACIAALQEIPEINAEIRGGDIVYKRHVHLGVAVQTPRGLVVPIVHHADTRGFADLEREIARLAAAARDNRLTLEELSGGTFTVSNGGVFGSLLSTPILNPPQSGILGMHKIEKRPVVVNDQVVIRPMMYLALSYDHRIVDGEQAVTFLVKVKERLEDPERMLLDL